MENKVSLDSGGAGKTTPAKKPKRINRIIFLASSLIILNALLTHSFESRSTKTLKIGDSLPAYSLTMTNGKKMTSADFTGKPTMYFFYADWCPCSHKSAWPIKQAHKEYKSRGLEVVAIGLQDTSDKLAKFAKTHELDFPVCADGGQVVASEMGVTITPTTVFVDKDGVIQSVFVGRVDRFDQLTDGLNSILPSHADKV